MDVARQAKVRRVEDLVCARVIYNGLCMHACFMGEGAEASDGVVERRVNLHSLSNHILNLGKVSSRPINIVH